MMQSNVSLDFYLFLKCHSLIAVFFLTYFANQLSGSFVSVTVDVRVVRKSNSCWKYCISLEKYPGLNTLTGMPNRKHKIK